MTKFQTWKKIISHLVSTKKKLPILIPLMLIYVLFLASSPYFYKLLIDWLEKNLWLWNMTNELFIIVWIWIIAIISTIWMRYLYAMKLLENVQDDWFNFIMKSTRKMMKLPINYHISLQHGEKQKIIERASEAVRWFGDSWMAHIIPQFLVSVILIISGLIINVNMTIISLLLLPFAIYGIRTLGNKAYTNQSKANWYWDSFFNRIVDTFTNLKIIRIFSREKNEENILINKFKLAKNTQYDIRKLWVIFNWMSAFITTLAQAITISWGIYLLLNQEITLWTLFFFIGFTERIYGPIFIIFEQMQAMLINIAWFEKMQKLFDMENETNNGTRDFEWIQKSIVFKDVSFTYPSTSREVLDKVNIEIKKWEKIALIWRTWSGKSTIIQLLMRFYDTTSWSILFDWETHSDFTLESYRNKFASVFQDTTLFNESIRHNLEYIRDWITQKDIEKACKEANILDFIQSLPEKWETEVGERWLKLSWWEKQRLAIARAILANPEILILDEATSAMDSETEKLIQDSLEKLMEWRTSIIIAHRLSTIKNVDRIYMLDWWKIVANGTHKELLKNNTQYKKMIALQHEWFLWDEVKHNLNFDGSES